MMSTVSSSSPTEQPSVRDVVNKMTVAAENSHHRPKTEFRVAAVFRNSSRNFDSINKMLERRILSISESYNQLKPRFSAPPTPVILSHKRPALNKNHSIAATSRPLASSTVLHGSQRNQDFYKRLNSTTSFANPYELKLENEEMKHALEHLDVLHEKMAVDYMNIALNEGVFAKMCADQIICFPTIVKLYEDVGADAHVISVKGWGSRIMQTDIEAFTFNYDMTEIEPFFIQWDGDRITNENFTRYILEIVELDPGKVLGFICTKAKKRVDMPGITNDLQAFFNKNGLAALTKYTNKPIYVAVMPLEDHELHSASNYGIFGAVTNRIFKPKLILYFGGGVTILHEFTHGLFIQSTPRVIFNITRSNGAELPTKLPDVAA